MKKETEIDLKKILSSRIKKARQAKGLTQPELAELIDSTDRNISNYETGYSYPSIRILYLLSTALSTSVDYLFGLTNNPNISKEQNNSHLTETDYRLLNELKNNKQMYQLLAENPEKGVHYIYKIWKLMNEWND